MSSIWTIRRSTTDVKLSGLCGGVAQRWGVDPVLVRVGCALLALSGGIGIVLYLAGWLLIPVEGSDRARMDDLLGGPTRTWPKEAWLAIVAIACVVVFTLLSFVMPFGFGPAIILAVIWYFGYYKNRTPDRRRPQTVVPPPPEPVGAGEAPPQFFHYPGPPTEFTRAADAWRERIEENARRGAAPGPVASPAFGPQADDVESRGEPSGPAARVSSSQRSASVAYALEQREFWAHPDPVGLYLEPLSAAGATIGRAQSLSARRLRLVAVIALGLSLSGLGLAQYRGVSVPVAAYFGAALLVVGLALVAATWLGRARGILPVGLLLVVAVVVSSLTGPVAKTNNWGPQHLAYVQLADLPAHPDSQHVGKLTVDLSRLAVTRDATYAAHVDLGSLEVVVPKNVNVRVKYSVDSGVLLNGADEAKSGHGLAGVIEPPVTQAGKATLTLDLSVDQGELRVRP